MGLPCAGHHSITWPGRALQEMQLVCCHQNHHLAAQIYCGDNLAASVGLVGGLEPSRQAGAANPLSQRVVEQRAEQCRRASFRDGLAHTGRSRAVYREEFVPETGRIVLA